MGGTYYEQFAEYLQKRIRLIDLCKDRKEKTKEKYKPDSLIYKERSKEYRNKIKKQHENIKIKNEEFRIALDKKGKKAYEDLLDLSININNLDLKLSQDIEKFKKIKKKYYDLIKPHIETQKILSKKIKFANEEILERVRRV